MHADRKPRLFRGFVNRPVAALAERLDVASPARLRISLAAAGPSSLPTTTEPFRRESLLVHFSICQSLIAEQSAALSS